MTPHGVNHGNGLSVNGGDPPQQDMLEYVYALGIGSIEDQETGQGGLYYIETRHGEKALPVFTTPEKCREHFEANFDTPEEYVKVLESAGIPSATTPTEGHYSILWMEYPRGLAEVVAMIEADLLVRDPKPGKVQEVMRLTPDPGPQLTRRERRNLRRTSKRRYT